MVLDIHARETHEITIGATLVEGVDDDGQYYPEAVIVSGASFLQSSAIADIAQETINSYYGSYSHGYKALRPTDWAGLTEDEREDYRVTVEKKG